MSRWGIILVRQTHHEIPHTEGSFFSTSKNPKNPNLLLAVLFRTRMARITRIFALIRCIVFLQRCWLTSFVLLQQCSRPTVHDLWFALFLSHRTFSFVTQILRRAQDKSRMAQIFRLTAVYWLSSSSSLQGIAQTSLVSALASFVGSLTGRGPCYSRSNKRDGILLGSW